MEKENRAMPGCSELCKFLRRTLGTKVQKNLTSQKFEHVDTKNCETLDKNIFAVE